MQPLLHIVVGTFDTFARLKSSSEFSTFLHVRKFCLVAKVFLKSALFCLTHFIYHRASILIKVFSLFSYNNSYTMLILHCICVLSHSSPGSIPFDPLLTQVCLCFKDKVMPHFSLAACYDYMHPYETFHSLKP